ncbi:MAG: amidohydrolase family protein [Bacteroidales bacterium]|jgi:dihydropyrimidinase
MYDLLVKNGKVWKNGHFESTNVYVKDGVFACFSQELWPAKDSLDASTMEVLPGMIDPHVHFALNLGKSHSADDFYSGSVSAAFGGITTFIDFLEPADNALALEKAFYERMEEAKKSVVDYKFHATIKNPKGHVGEFVQKMLELGMTSVKLFTTYSNSGRRTYDPEIKELLRLSEKYGFMVTAHIENDDMIGQDPDYTYRDLGKSRPSQAETSEALKLAGFVRECGGTLYMVHLSSGITLEKLKAKFPDILHKKLFIESCPQYLLLDETWFQKENGFLYTMAPPIRRKAECLSLNRLFSDIDTIGTDHCPFFRAEKNTELLKNLPLGIGGVEHAFSLLYPNFQTTLIPKMAENSARIHKLAPRKGEITLGSDADMVIFKPDLTAKIEKSHSLSDYDPYEGFPSGGTIESTILRGKFIVRNHVFLGGTGQMVPGGKIE